MRIDTDAPNIPGRWTLDGEPVDVNEFIRENEMDAYDVNTIAFMRRGDETVFGGGAFGVFILKREA